MAQSCENVGMRGSLDPLLQKWWEDMQTGMQMEISKLLGDLVYLPELKPDIRLIQALIPYWDPSRKVFRFKDCELTPTIEEIAAFTKLKGITKEQTFTRMISPNAFMRKMGSHPPDGVPGFDQGWCTVEYLYNLFGKEKVVDDLIREKRENQRLGKLKKDETIPCMDAFRANRKVAYIIAFLGTFVFPVKDGRIDLRAGFVYSSTLGREDRSLVPMILSDIYRALTNCKNGGRFFEGCNYLLQMWAMEHLIKPKLRCRYRAPPGHIVIQHRYHLEGKEWKIPKTLPEWEAKLQELDASKIEWCLFWMDRSEIAYKCEDHPYLLLYGFRGIQHYYPSRVLRQLGRKQGFPLLGDASPNVQDIPRVAGELNELEIDKHVGKCWKHIEYLGLETLLPFDQWKCGEVDSSYAEWFKDQPQIEVERSKQAGDTIARLRREKTTIIEEKDKEIQILHEHYRKLLEKKEQNVDLKIDKIWELRREVRTRDRMLAEKDQELDVQKVKEEDLRRRISTRNMMINQKNAEIDEGRRKADTMRQTIEALQRQVNDQTAHTELAYLQQELNDRNADIRNLQNTVNSQHNNLIEFQRLIDEQHTELTNHIRENTALLVSLNNQEVSSLAREIRVNNLQIAVDEQRLEITTLQNQVNELQAIITAKEVEVTARDQLIDEMVGIATALRDNIGQDNNVARVHLGSNFFFGNLNRLIERFRRH